MRRTDGEGEAPVSGMRRREFITLLGGAALGWPIAARSQQPKMLRVGFVGIQPREFPVYAAFLMRMAELGYQEGRNFVFEYLQPGGNVTGIFVRQLETASLGISLSDTFVARANEVRE